MESSAASDQDDDASGGEESVDEDAVEGSGSDVAVSQSEYEYILVKASLCCLLERRRRFWIRRLGARRGCIDIFWRIGQGARDYPAPP